MKFNLVFMFSLIIGLLIVSCSAEDFEDGNGGAKIVSTVDNFDGTFTLSYSDGSSMTISDFSEINETEDDEISSQGPIDE